MVMFFVNPEEKIKQTVMFSLLSLSGLYLVDKTSNNVFIEIYSNSSLEVLSNNEGST